MPVIDNLMIKLGYEYEEKNMEKFNSLATGTTRILKSASLATIGLATSFALLFSKLSNNALAQQRFGKSMDVSRESIAAFTRTSEELTGDRGVAGRFIEQFNGIQNALKAGIAPSENFLRVLSTMGITLDEFQSLSPDSVLLRLATGFQALDEDSKDATSSLLGLDSAGRNLFSGLTAQKIRDNIPSQADIESIERFDKLLKDLQQTFSDSVVKFGTPLFEKLIPAIESLNESMPQIIDFAGQASSAFFKLGEAIGTSIGFLVVNMEKLSNLLKSIISPISNSSFQSPDNEFSGLTGIAEGFLKQEFGFFGGGNTNNSSSNVTQNINVQVNTDNPNVLDEMIRRINGENLSKAQKTLSTSVVN